MRAGSTVGLCLERGRGTDGGMLGVMKAERRTYRWSQRIGGAAGMIVGDAKPALVVGEESAAEAGIGRSEGSGGGGGSSR